MGYIAVDTATTVRTAVGPHTDTAVATVVAQDIGVADGFATGTQIRTAAGIESVEDIDIVVAVLERTVIAAGTPVATGARTAAQPGTDCTTGTGVEVAADSAGTDSVGRRAAAGLGAETEPAIEPPVAIRKPVRPVQ